MIAKVDPGRQIVSAGIQKNHLAAGTRRNRAADLCGGSTRAQRGTQQGAVRQAAECACIGPVRRSTGVKHSGPLLGDTILRAEKQQEEESESWLAYHGEIPSEVDTVVPK
jgi:hypothetical protein